LEGYAAMVRHASFISVAPDEVKRIESAMRAALRENRFRLRRRLHAIWFSAQGWTVKRIARRLKTSESKACLCVARRQVWLWRKVYKGKGIEGLKGKYFSKKL
jgi:hypothetical protein